MIKGFFREKVISPAEEEAIEEAIGQIKEKFSSLQRETLFISLSVLLVMFLLPLVMSDISAKALSGILLWSAFAYSAYHTYLSRKDVFCFIKVRSLQKFIYQKIHTSVKEEIDNRLNKKSVVENIIFDLLGDGTPLLAHRISSRVESISRDIILKNLMIIAVIIVVYYLMRNYLAYQSYHLSVVEIMLFR